MTAIREPLYSPETEVLFTFNGQFKAGYVRVEPRRDYYDDTNPGVWQWLYSVQCPDGRYAVAEPELIEWLK